MWLLLGSVSGDDDIQYPVCESVCVFSIMYKFKSGFYNYNYHHSTMLTNKTITTIIHYWAWGLCLHRPEYTVFTTCVITLTCALCHAKQLWLTQAFSSQMPLYANADLFVYVTHCTCLSLSIYSFMNDRFSLFIHRFLWLDSPAIEHSCVWTSSFEVKEDGTTQPHTYPQSLCAQIVLILYLHSH